jgi:hypothetical protein
MADEPYKPKHIVATGGFTSQPMSVGDTDLPDDPADPDESIETDEVDG